MKIDILTLFPGLFDSFLSHSIIKRALKEGKLDIQVHDLRDYTHDRHKTCDDKPFGGGPGMLMKPEPIFEAADKLFGKVKKTKKNFRFVYMTPQGSVFNQKKAEEFAQVKRIVILCGRYEGVDERVIDELVTDEVSIGDYVLNGGEIPAMVMIEGVARLVKGVLGREESKDIESFSQNLLEYPQYTRPAVYRGLKVPPVLLSGNHKDIEVWRQKEAYGRTLKRRPDLLEINKKKQGVRDASVS